MSGAASRLAAVTGASGFVGRAPCRRLRADGHEVLALLRRELQGPWDRMATCELGEGPVVPAILRNVDVIYHLAGIAHTRGVPEARYRQVNVEGTRALLEAAVAAGVRRFVHVSSVKAMADPPGEECVDERWTDWPEDAYGRSKRGAEELVLETAEKVGMHAVVIRPTLVYGPGVKGNLRSIMRLVESGWCPPLPDTKNRRSMVHVEDLAELAMRAAWNDRARGQIYIAADNSPVSTRALYEGLCHELQRPVPGWQLPAGLLRLAGRLGDAGSVLMRRSMPVDSGMVSRLLDSACYQSDKAQNELGWHPQHDLLSSLPEMVAAWKMGHNASRAES